MKTINKIIICVVLWVVIGFSAICYNWTQSCGYDLTVYEIPLFVFVGAVVGPTVIPFIVMDKYAFNEIVLIKGKN